LEGALNLTLVSRLLQSLLTFDNGLSLIQAASTTTGNAIQNGQTLATALATGTPLATQFPKNSYFASQLQQVAKIIQVRAALGLQRQIFFVSMGGFDTHSGQLTQQDSLFNDMNQSLSAFYQATTEMGVANNVTTFTLSDFGRTYQPNSDGTDHAWVRQSDHGWRREGGDFYGTFNAGSERSRRWHGPGPVGSDDLGRSVRRNLGTMVRRGGGGLAIDLPEPGELPDADVGNHGLAQRIPQNKKRPRHQRRGLCIFAVEMRPHAPLRAPAAKDTTPASTKTPATSGGKRSLCSVCTPISASPIFTP
jgi:hypothetical protein